jgi:GNAT superfamily N-acetyltransferase
MNKKITNNLFEFWSYIGKQNNIYSDYSNYKAVSVLGSEWPNRIYYIEDKIEIYDEIIELCNQNLLPNIITLDTNLGLLNPEKTQLLFTQTNMSLDLKHYTNKISKNSNIYQIETKVDAIDFANIASQSFGYRVDSEIVYNICKESCARLFIFKENGEGYGCGIVFFDIDNNAGFHMIGTIPNGRGKGIGKSITERLIEEALINNSRCCVLNASKMGEPIYERLGFTKFGVLENYRILK